MKKSLATRLSILLLLSASPMVWAGPKDQSADEARSAAAFRRVAEVLRHPRCMNCHTKTDFPRQTDERKRHAMGVLRGADNAGVIGMRCATCHADENVLEVPGAPHWALAPLSMAWEGLSDAELAEALKNKAKNGQRSLEDLYKHMAEDALVAWAWNPGGSRLPPPISHEEFARLVREWIDSGAVTPAALVGAASTAESAAARPASEKN